MNERTLEQYHVINITDILTEEDKGTQSVYFWHQLFDIDYLESNLGHGKVPFFRCPGCGKRRRELYYVSDKWRCYRCHNLVYNSQQRAKTNPSYWYRRAEEEARKIDPTFKISGINDVLNHELIFPLFKPKHMKQSAFDNIRFWYGMYMFRGIVVLHESLRSARAFIESTKQNVIDSY